MNPMPACNQKLKTLRLEAKLSQNKLAQRADLDRGTVSAAERGGDVTEITVSKLAAALTKALRREIKLDDLVAS